MGKKNLNNSRHIQESVLFVNVCNYHKDDPDINLCPDIIAVNPFAACYPYKTIVFNTYIALKPLSIVFPGQYEEMIAHCLN